MESRKFGKRVRLVLHFFVLGVVGKIAVVALTYFNPPQSDSSQYLTYAVFAFFAAIAICSLLYIAHLCANRRSLSQT